MATTTDEDLNQLAKDVRQLKIEYEQYFGGGRSRPPTDAEWRIEQLIKRYAERTAEITFGQRFRYNNLAQTYAKYREIFRKRLKMKEEGRVPRHYGEAAKKLAAERAGRRAARGVPHKASATVFTMACADPERESDKVEELYQAFLRAKQKAGEKTDRLRLDTFQQFVRQKVRQFQEQRAGEQVEFVVALENGQVRLKARMKK